MISKMKTEKNTDDSILKHTEEDYIKKQMEYWTGNDNLKGNSVTSSPLCGTRSLMSSFRISLFLHFNLVVFQRFQNYFSYPF